MLHNKQSETQIRPNPWGTIFFLPLVEEVPVKWMDRPSATETERGCASETDRRKSAKTWKCH